MHVATCTAPRVFACTPRFSLNPDATDRQKPNVRLRKQRTFKPSVFDMAAVSAMLLRVHWPLIYVAAFLIIHQGVCVCVCLRPQHRDL